MKVVLSLFLFVSILSCNSNVLPDTKSDINGDTKPTETHYVVKIEAVFYRNGEISKVDSVSNFVDLYMNEDSKPTAFDSLQAGIQVLKDTSILINVKDKSEDEKTSILWVGYTFDDEENTTSKSIEVLVDKNITLNLVVKSDKDIVEIPKQRMFLTIDGNGNGSVKVGGNIYANGYYDIIFLSEQKVMLEALLPTNKNVVFSGFTSSLGLNDTNMTTEVVMSTDMVIGAKFLNMDIVEKVAVIIATVAADKGSVYVNDIKIPATGLHIIPDLTVGAKIKLRAEPANERMFSSWNDDLKGFLSSVNEYTYIVSGNAVITPIFSALSGVVSFSINPRTNYFTEKTMHRENLVYYKVIRDNVIVQSSTNFGGNKSPLNWVNNTIKEIDSGDIIELTASQGVGFYDKAGVMAGEKVSWSGDTEQGPGLTRTIVAGAKSKSVNLNFEIEKRNITVAIDRENEPSSDGTWIKEHSTNNAKGFTIIINETNVVKDMLSVTKTFDWHTKVKVEVLAGAHYSNYKIDNNATLNPEEDYYTGNPKISTVTFDLENNATNTAIIRHKKVDMTLSIKGGNFAKEDNRETKYVSYIYVRGSGSPDYDKDYYSSNYYNGEEGTESYYNYKIPVLSGMPTHIFAVTTPATVFTQHKSSLIATTTATTALSNIIVTNKALNFTVKSDFISPLHKLSVNMRGVIETGGKYATEGLTNKVDDYYFTIASKGNTQYKENSSFDITNGIPVKVNAYPGTKSHYTTYQIGGSKNVADKTYTISNATSIDIEYAHIKRKIKLNVIGGKDDNNKSHVKIENTGLPEYNKTFYAGNRNIDIKNKKIDVPVSYEFYALSGLTNRVKINAITSPVHNFHKMEWKDVAVTLDGELKAGRDTYRTTNTSIINVVQDVAAPMNIVFRINSFQGVANGLKSGDDGYDLFNLPDDGRVKVIPLTENGIKTWDVYSVHQLMYLSDINPNDFGGNNFKNERIRLRNDIYFGNERVTTVAKAYGSIFSHFNGQFAGGGYTIYDVNIAKSFINRAVNAHINSFTMARGRIGENLGSYGGEYGIVGDATSSVLKYITNYTSILVTNGSHIGGVLGYSRENNELSYLANYGHIYGNKMVGGVVGWMNGGGEGYSKNSYLYNRGKVEGEEKVGGVVGYIDHAKARLYYVYNSGEIIANSRQGGGIVGYMGWSRDGDIRVEHFYNTGKVSKKSGGLAGFIYGWRERISGAWDDEGESYPFSYGYNLDKYNPVYEAGYQADVGGAHMIYLTKVHIMPKGTDGLGWTEPVKGVDRQPGDDGANFGNGNPDPGNFVMMPDKEDWYGGECWIITNKIDTEFYPGFKDKSIWVQSSGLPAINGITMRPTFINMPEVDLPSYMFE